MINLLEAIETDRQMVDTEGQIETERYRQTGVQREAAKETERKRKREKERDERSLDRHRKRNKEIYIYIYIETQRKIESGRETERKGDERDSVRKRRE